jgi:phosphoglycolate phosphatase-like HAD superfamily hydrolase
MRTLVLWDIDGTLLTGSQAASTAFNSALREIYELGNEPARIDYGGKTDTQIVMEVLALHQIAELAARERLSRFQERYTDLVGHAFDELCSGVRVLPGVPAVLQALQGAGALQSTLTGNFRATAELKLRAAGLYDQLNIDIGAFGSDHHDRHELVPIAYGKAQARFGQLGKAVVVGDTPRDIACGKAGGARTVAVATGNWSMAELHRYAPDVMLRDLTDTDAAVAAILG